MIEKKSFDVVSRGKSWKAMRICENRRGLRVSISLEEDEVGWLVGVLEDFYWRKGEHYWVRTGRRETTDSGLGWNRNGRFLVLLEERGKQMNRIFIPDEEQAGGWWRLMKAVFDLADHPIVNPDKRGKPEKVAIPGEGEEMKVMSRCYEKVHCSHCRNDFWIALEGAKKLNFAEAMKNGKRMENWVGQKIPAKVMDRVKFEIQSGTNSRQEENSLNGGAGGYLGDSTLKALGDKSRELGGKMGKARKLTWAEKGEWIDQAGPSRRIEQNRKVGRRSSPLVKWM